MTTNEFSLEFDILYDSISSMDAPGLDEYEKSVFLTQAQLQLIKEYNDPPVMKSRFRTTVQGKSGFEGSDKRRADFSNIIKPYQTAPTKITNGLFENSYLATLPTDVFLIKYEAGIINKTATCPQREVEIIPIKYDELHDRRRNPFKRTDKNNGFRLDVSFNEVKSVELVLDEAVDYYRIRYVKYPNPIILADLGGISTLPLTIDGRQTITECELDVELHREILDRAVQLAMLAYKQESLVAKVQLDQRTN